MQYSSIILSVANFDILFTYFLLGNSEFPIIVQFTANEMGNF